MTRARNIADVQDNGVSPVAPFLAGKNKIINGDYGINQRNFTSVTTNLTYTYDRWLLQSNTGPVTATPQNFTPGSAPVSGYEGNNFMQVQVTNQTATNAYAIISQRIEDVRTLAGQTFTMSFWARATSGTPKVALEMYRAASVGTGSFYVGQVTISTSWARYSITGTMPSLSGMTAGAGSFIEPLLWFSAGSDFNSRTGSIGIQNNTFQFWGMQLEAGSVATPFTLAGGGSQQAELALCQRYYFRNTATDNAYGPLIGGFGMAYATGTVMLNVQHPVQMRTRPSSTIEYGGTPTAYNGVDTVTGVTFSYNTGTSLVSNIILNKSASFTQYRPYGLVAWNDATTYFGLSAEL